MIAPPRWLVATDDNPTSKAFLKGARNTAVVRSICPTQDGHWLAQVAVERTRAVRAISSPKKLEVGQRVTLTDDGRLAS